MVRRGGKMGASEGSESVGCPGIRKGTVGGPEGDR